MLTLFLETTHPVQCVNCASELSSDTDWITGIFSGCQSGSSGMTAASMLYSDEASKDLPVRISARCENMYRPGAILIVTGSSPLNLLANAIAFSKLEIGSVIVPVAWSLPFLASTNTVW